jgi:hypothetical protein
MGQPFAEALANAGTSPSLRMLPAAIFGIIECGDHEVALILIKTFMQSTNELLRTSAAGALRYIVGNPIVSEEEAVGLVAQGLRDESLFVRQPAIYSLLQLVERNSQRSADLLAAVEWDNDSNAGEAVCSLLSPNHGIDPALLSDEQIDAIIERIAVLPSIRDNHYHILQMIAYTSRRRPRQTVDMLLTRITDLDRSGYARDRMPFPFDAHGLTLPGLMQAPDYPSLLRLVRDAVVARGSGVDFWLPALFSTCATDLEAAVTVLREWVVPGNPEQLMGAARLLNGFDHSIVFDLHPYIADLIDAAAKTSTKCLQRVESELFGLAIGGMYSSVPGQPAPRHVADKAEARKLVEYYASRQAVRDFYERLEQYSDSSIDREMKDWEEEDED